MCKFGYLETTLSLRHCYIHVDPLILAVLSPIESDEFLYEYNARTEKKNTGIGPALDESESKL